MWEEKRKGMRKNGGGGGGGGAQSKSERERDGVIERESERGQRIK